MYIFLKLLLERSTFSEVASIALGGFRKLASSCSSFLLFPFSYLDILCLFFMCLYTESNLLIERRFSYFQLHVMLGARCSKQCLCLRCVFDQTRERYEVSPPNETHSTRGLTPSLNFCYSHPSRSLFFGEE